MALIGYKCLLYIFYSLLTRDEARRIAARHCAAATLLFSGLWYLPGFWVDKMNSPTSGTRYGLVRRAAD